MRDEMKEYIKSQEPVFLTRARHKGYVCPVCRNGSGKDGDGITRKRGSNYYHCFKCGLHDDIFGLIGKAFDLADFTAQAEKACELYGLTAGETYTPAPLEPVQEEPETETDHTAEFRKWNEAINVPGNAGLAYLESRGLSLETINRFNVGFASKWKHPKTAHLSKVSPTPRVIIPTSKTSYLARDVRDKKDIPENQRKYTKSKVSRIRLFNQSALTEDTDVIFVVEGEIDAMSVAELGYTALGLGSASNKIILVKALQEHKPKGTIVLLPDNDSAGKDAAFEIRTELREAGINALAVNIFGDCKDANEMLVKDRDGLKRKLARIVSEVTSAPTEVKDATNRALLKLLNLHERHRTVLREKGLSDDQIRKFGYRSVPSAPKEIAMQLRRNGCTLDGISPFEALPSGEWTINYPGPGILVPARNTRGQIQGFEFIPDEGEGSCDATHFRRGARGTGSVVLTGSPLSADIICSLSGYSVLSVGDLGSKRHLASELRTLLKHDMKKVRIALTDEAQIKAVCRMLDCLCPHCGMLVRPKKHDQTESGKCPRCGKSIGLKHSVISLDPEYRSLEEYLLQAARNR